MAVKFEALGYVTVTAAGTPVQVSANDIRTPAVHIQAATTNAGLVYVGGSSLDATHRGVELSPGAGIEITGPSIGGIEEEMFLSELKIDAATNGDKVLVSYFVRR